ncbi:MAG: recombinase family protein [Syntrophobacteraceae bacterium]
MVSWLKIQPSKEGLRQAIDLRQNGYSYNRIAGALNAQGIPSKTASRWD